ncbi:hypothetical protein ACIQKB_36055 [Streptomyces sp. NPDC092046]|uniref:hypothetical protein n=1 Tax=Streptomyces sp. NPDC092046 TaxID=3366009 RepID=UPI00381E5D97
MASDDGPDFEIPVALFEDIEDLKAQFLALSAQVKALREASEGVESEASTDDNADAGEEAEDGTGEWKFPRSSCCLTPRSTTRSSAP